MILNAHCCLVKWAGIYLVTVEYEISGLIVKHLLHIERNSIKFTDRTSKGVILKR